MTSWMQKLRDAKTNRSSSDIATCLEAFLDHFQERSLWTNTMVPLQRRGRVQPVQNMKIIKGPDDSKAAQGVHVHYALAQRLIMFRIDTFLNFLWARNHQDISEPTVMFELRKIYNASTHQGRLCRCTPYMHPVNARFVAVPAPPGSLLERRMFGENSAAVESAMQLFEEALQRRRERERERAANDRRRTQGISPQARSGDP